MKNLSQRSTRGELPNPEGFGLRWGPLQKLLAEQRRMFGESRDAGFKLQELRDRLTAAERAEELALVRSFRSQGDEPDGAEAAELRAEVERAEKRLNAQQRALRQVEAEITATAAKHAEEWRAEVRAAAQEKAGAVEDAIRRLREAQQELSAYAALADWLERPQTGFGFGPGPHVIDTFNARGVNIGEVFDALVQDARETAASPEERQNLQYAALGLVTTQAPGWQGTAPPAG